MKLLINLGHLFKIYALIMSENICLPNFSLLQHHRKFSIKLLVFSHHNKMVSLNKKIVTWLKPLLPFSLTACSMINCMPSPVPNNKTLSLSCNCNRNSALFLYVSLAVHVLSILLKVKINSLPSFLSVFFSVTLASRKDIVAFVCNFNGILFMLMSFSLSLLHSSLRLFSIMNLQLINLLFQLWCVVPQPLMFHLRSL